MKISANNRPFVFAQQNELAKPLQTERGTQKTGGKFDDIHISQNPSAMPEDRFVNMLKEKLMAEVSRPTPTQQLELIKNQINSNTYSVNLDEVAKKILLT